ncbi:MAG: gamma-glutamylcyclotransferase family protein [Bacillota bacterium]
MTKLFVYGTLTNDCICKKLIGRVPQSIPAVLQNYTIDASEEYYDIVKKNGSLIKGRVLLLEECELLKLDQWEEMPLYVKQFVKVKYSQSNNETEEDVLVYIKSEKSVKGLIELIDFNSISNSSDIQSEVDAFVRTRGDNVPISDVYLLYPIEIVSDGILKKQIKEDMVGKYFCDEMNTIVDFEYKHNTMSRPVHEYLGNVTLSSNCMQDGVTNFETKVKLFISRTVCDDIGVLIISAPVFISDPCYLNFCGISEMLDINGESLETYLKNHCGIRILDIHKIAVFSSDKWVHKDIKKLFAGEVNPIGELVGKTICHDASINIAQYSSAEIYASTIGVLEIPNVFNSLFLERIQVQCLTLFIVEVFLYQFATISLHNERLAGLIKNTKKVNIENLMIDMRKSLAIEQGYWSLDNYKFPISKFLADQISKSMRISDLNEQMMNNDAIAEQLVNIRYSLKENVKMKVLNRLLLFLAIVQLFSIVLGMVGILSEEGISLMGIQQYLISAGICIALWLIYIISRKLHMYGFEKLNKIDIDKKNL